MYPSTSILQHHLMYLSKEDFTYPVYLIFFEINENLTMRNVATVCLKVSPVDVPPVRRLQAGHLPRARPDTSSSSLPLAPLQWNKGG